MYMLFLSFLLLVQNIALAMSEGQGFAVDRVYSIVELTEQKMSAECINRLEVALPYVPNINGNYRSIKLPSVTIARSPLVAASQSNNITATRILLSHRADAKDRDGIGLQAVDYALRLKRYSLMGLLLEYGEPQIEYLNFFSCLGYTIGDEGQSVLETHRQKVAAEVALIFPRDPAGIVSEYVVER